MTTTYEEPTYPQVEGIPAHLTGPIRWDHPCRVPLVIKDGRVVPAPGTEKKKKVCIVGYAEDSRHLAWYDDPDCEIWGVNQLNRFIPRADRWFQIHTDWDDQTKWAEGCDQRAWLQTCPIPVYMVEQDPSIPNSVAYPKDWVKQQLKVHEYFTSSIAFMLSLAIAEGFTTIGMYGIDLIIGREYFFEKCCVEFYFGIAHAMGIDYHLPEKTALLWQSHTYGYETEPDYGYYGLERLRKRMRELGKAVTEYRDRVHVHQGRVDEAEFIQSKMGNEESRAQMEERVKTLRNELDKLLNALYMHDGAQQEVQIMYERLELASRGKRPST